jgi:hypothetical protein
MEDEIEAMGRIGANMKGSSMIDNIELRVVLDAGDTTGILVSKELHKHFLVPHQLAPRHKFMAY